jgi:hypothetical protein
MQHIADKPGIKRRMIFPVTAGHPQGMNLKKIIFQKRGIARVETNDLTLNSIFI